MKSLEIKKNYGIQNFNDKADLWIYYTSGRRTLHGTTL